MWRLRFMFFSPLCRSVGVNGTVCFRWVYSPTVRCSESWRQISPPGFLLDKRGNRQRPSQPATATITHQESGNTKEARDFYHPVTVLFADLLSKFMVSFGLDSATFLRMYSGYLH